MPQRGCNNEAYTERYFVYIYCGPVVSMLARICAIILTVQKREHDDPVIYSRTKLRSQKCWSTSRSSALQACEAIFCFLIRLRKCVELDNKISSPRIRWASSWPRGVITHLVETSRERTTTREKIKKCKMDLIDRLIEAVSGLSIHRRYTDDDGQHRASK